MHLRLWAAFPEPLSPFVSNMGNGRCGAVDRNPVSQTSATGAERQKPQMPVDHSQIPPGPQTHAPSTSMLSLHEHAVPPSDCCCQETPFLLNSCKLDPKGVSFGNVLVFMDRSVMHLLTRPSRCKKSKLPQKNQAPNSCSYFKFI